MWLTFQNLGTDRSRSRRERAAIQSEVSRLSDQKHVEAQAIEKDREEAAAVLRQQDAELSSQTADLSVQDVKLKRQNVELSRQQADLKTQALGHLADQRQQVLISQRQELE